ncbi:hypothetical protein HDE_04753 [Halotydeus destructor]|nr:hypothetical protein HDE_04753 [Halotydeus destructor]
MCFSWDRGRKRGKGVVMEGADGFTIVGQYVPFHREHSGLFGVTFASSDSCEHFYSLAEKQQIPEEVSHLGSVELIFAYSDCRRRIKFMLLTSNIPEDTEFSVRLYWTKPEDPNLYDSFGFCPELNFQVVNGYAVVMAYLPDGYLDSLATSKSVGRLIVHWPFTATFSRRRKKYSIDKSTGVDQGYVKLHSHDGHFEVCKQSLASHSEVFQAMFQNDFRERFAEVINLSYVHSSVLEIFLACMNKQPMQFKGENLAMDVLMFADMFDIRLLSHDTQDYLITKLLLGNVLTMTEFAKLYNAGILHKGCLDFIGRKIKLVGSKSLIGLDKITCINYLRQLIDCCDKFELYDRTFLHRSGIFYLSSYRSKNGPFPKGRQELLEQIVAVKLTASTDASAVPAS